MISLEGLKVISNFNEINFKELKELDQLLKVEKKYLEGEDISYTDSELMVVDSIEFNMLYGVNGFINRLHFYQVDTTDDEVKFNNIHYSSSRFNNYYLVFEHDENESISRECNLIATYETMDGNKTLEYLKDKLNRMGTYEFRTFSKSYYDEEECCAFSNNYIVYKNEHGYICLTLVDEIYHNIFDWDKVHRVYIIDNSLERCCQIDMELDDIFDGFKEVSKLHYNSCVYSRIEKEVKDVFKYRLEECIFNTEKQEQLLDYIFGYSYTIGNKLDRYELGKFFKPLYTNKEYGFSAYKKEFNAAFIKFVYDKDIDDETSKKLKLIANLILRYKIGSSKLNPYTGKLCDACKTEEVYNDGEYILLKDISISPKNLTYDNFIKYGYTVSSKVNLYKKYLDSYIEITRIDSCEERDKVQEIFNNIEIASKLQGY